MNDAEPFHAYLRLKASFQVHSDEIVGYYSEERPTMTCCTGLL